MTFKVLILGDAGVGKTSLRTKYLYDTFTFSYRATIGANFLSKSVVLSTPGTTTTPVVLCLWDTAGQERFNALSPTFFRGADAVILLHDLSHPPSAESLGTHYAGFKRFSASRDPVVLVVGNKLDAVRPDDDDADRRRDRIARIVDTFEPDQHNEDDNHDDHDERPGIGIFEVSAKVGHGVDAVFTTLAARLHERGEAKTIEPFEVDGQNLHSTTGIIDLKRPWHKSHSSCSC